MGINQIEWIKSCFWSSLTESGILITDYSVRKVFCHFHTGGLIYKLCLNWESLYHTDSIHKPLLGGPASQMWKVPGRLHMHGYVGASSLEWRAFWGENTPQGGELLCDCPVGPGSSSLPALTPFAGRVPALPAGGRPSLPPSTWGTAMCLVLADGTIADKFQTEA